MDRELKIIILDEGIVISNTGFLINQFGDEKSERILSDIIVKLTATHNYILLCPVPVSVEDLRNKKILT